MIFAQEEISGQDSESAGIIEIGATEVALHLFLLAAPGDFKMKYPKIRIKVHNHSTRGILKDFAAGNLELAVVTTPFQEPDGVHCETMRNFGEILVGGSQYKRLARRVLVQIPVDGEMPMRSVKLISEKGRAKTRAADTFYRYLKSKCSNEL